MKREAGSGHELRFSSLATDPVDLAAPIP
jgi:hypothetical protein